MKLTKILKDNPIILVFLFFLLINIIIFRGPLLDLPSIIAGEKVLSAEELVPIFDLKTQFIDQITNGYSELTDNYESRIIYSVLTTWVRYYPILPIMLIILNAISGTILYFSSVIFIRTLNNQIKINNNELILILLTTTFVYLIMLFSKIAHFYTLIFGFSLFVFSIVLFVKGIENKKPKLVLLSSLIAFFNPAIHFHVLYPMTITMYSILSILFENRVNIKKDLIYTIKYTLIAIIFSTIIYYLIIQTFIISQNPTLLTEIPVSYRLISTSSNPSITSVLSYDSAAQINQFLFGNYFLPTPNIFNLFFIIILGLGLIYTNKNKIINIFYLIFCISIFFAMGLTSEFSFYTVTNYIFDTINTLSPTFATLLNLLVQILRFPHRFQFIQLLATLLLSNYFLITYFRTCFDKNIKLIINLALILIILSNITMISIFLTGNYAGFFKSYELPSDLNEIKTILDLVPTNEKILILPSIQSGVRVESNGNKLYFIDKFYIYYINKSSYDYVTSGSLQNRANFYLIYRGFYYNQSFWENELQSLNVKYVLFNKKIMETKSNIYLPGLKEKMNNALNTSQKTTLVYDGNNFALYKIASKNDTNCITLIDINWITYLKIFNYNQHISNRLDNCKIYKTYDKPSVDYINYIITDNKEKTILDLLITKDNFFSPNTNSAPFSENYAILTSYSNLFSLFSLLRLDKWNEFGLKINGYFDTLTLNLYGTKSPQQFVININNQNDSNIDLIYLRGKTTNNFISITLINENGEKIITKDFETNNSTDTINAFEYYQIYSKDLEKGKYKIILDKKDNSPFVFEGILLTTSNDIKDLEERMKKVEIFVVK